MFVTELFGKHKGEDVFIVGCGPSVQGLDFKRLSNKTIVAVNRAVLYFKDVDAKIYHIWKDKGLERFEKYIYPDNTIPVTTKKRTCRAKRTYCFEMFNKYRHDPQFPTLDSFPTTDIGSKLWPGPTETNAIHLAYKFGAKRIFLVGIDHYYVGDQYYANLKDKNRIYRIGRELKPTTNKKGQTHDMNLKKQDRYLKKCAEAFRLAGLYQDKHPGSGVFNLSKDSFVNVFEKVCMDSVL